MTSALELRRSISPARVAGVTIVLITTGALAGAVAGAIGSSLWFIATGDALLALSPRLWWLTGLIGAPFGAVLLPLAGFTALRRVPLGRLLATVTLTTAVSSAIAATVSQGAAWLVGAIAGFVAATGWLWYRSR